MRYVVFIAALLAAFMPSPADAVPKQVIILRHGEKMNAYALCGIGQQRSLALAANYLGKNAAQSLFGDGGQPAAFMTITLHTLELSSPAAATWQMPETNYSVVPLPKGSSMNESDALDLRTRTAAHDVLTSPLYDGKIVVMTWEHKHIANEKLEKQSSYPMTLRQLLHLDALGKQVPKTWDGNNYDYFWIVDYAPGNTTPVSFHMVKQVFPAPFQAVASNEWKAPENLPSGSGCL